LRGYSLMEQISDAIFVIDAGNAALVEVNNQACHSLGYSREELLTLDVHRLSNALPDAAAWQAFHAGLHARGQIFLETGLRRRDGGIMPVQINARLIEADGQAFVVAAARDLSRIREQDAQLQLQIHALNAAGNAIIITDTTPRILWANAAFTTLTGYSLAEAIGRKPAELVKSGEQDQLYYRQMWDSILAGQVWRGELVNRHKDGSLYHEDLTITPVAIDGKAVSHFVAIKQDISARRAAEATLRESEESYRGLFNSVAEAIYILDESGHFLDVNTGVERMYGYSRDELIGQTPAFLVAPGMNDLDELAERIRRAFAGEPQQGEIWGRRKNGEIFPKEAWINKGRYFGHDVVIAVCRDATERRAAEDELRRLAATDALTGLANRRHFLDQMTLALARQKRHDTHTALLMLDLDWFKNVNDQYGHAAGDEVLRHTAAVMASSLRRIDLLGRLGGEEFAILLPDTEADGAHEFAERLRQLVAAQPTHGESGDIPITLSIGVTSFAAQDSDIDAILARADRALYRAKENGRNRVELEPLP
ncbi:MAG: PAS domain S-box protein, partial [Gammaproteobacteria bacterium]|nr:PAS domain S-box protein [Gammaproteobacteria bacterium]